MSRRISASGHSYHHHSTNPWIFREGSQAEEPEVATCYGSQCPPESGSVTVPTGDSKVVIYMPWLSDSFLLLPIIRNRISLFGADYHSELYELLNKEDEVGISDIVFLARSPGSSVPILFIEYRKFPPHLLKKFRKASSHTEDIAIVQYSLLFDLKGSTSVGDYEVSKTLLKAISYLPENF